jgi:hypothetical protein
MKEGFTLIKVLLPVDPSSSQNGITSGGGSIMEVETLEQIQ